MTLRVRLDVGALSRALGESEQAIGPAALDELVIPFIDVTPFLIPTAAAAPSTTIPATFVPLGSGAIRVFPVASPAAGADVSISVPNGVAWQPILFFLRYVASAVAAARRLRLDFLDNTSGRIMLVPTLTVINASEGWDVTWAQGINSRLASGGDLISSTDIPNLLTLGPGFIIRTLTAAISAADQIQEVRLLVREFPV